MTVKSPSAPERTPPPPSVLPSSLSNMDPAPIAPAVRMPTQRRQTQLPLTPATLTPLTPPLTLVTLTPLTLVTLTPTPLTPEIHPLPPLLYTTIQATQRTRKNPAPRTIPTPPTENPVHPTTLRLVALEPTTPPTTATPATANVLSGPIQDPFQDPPSLKKEVPLMTAIRMATTEDINCWERQDCTATTPSSHVDFRGS